MIKDEYYSFTEMIEKGKVTRSTLSRMIKDGKVKYKTVGFFNQYSLRDVINNKPRKNEP